MTENEKIELFDKWYDENYDEWAEGEEGIALREELEQAFKGGVEVLEAENAELKDYRLTTLAKQQTGMSKYALNLEHKLSWYDDQLTKAKELLKEFVHHYKNKTIYIENMQDLLEQVEQFIKDSEGK